MDSKIKLKLSFKVKETSEGHLAQGMEIPAIIIESPTKEQLQDDLSAACECYFKSFPEDLQKYTLTENERIKNVELTV